MTPDRAARSRERFHLEDAEGCGRRSATATDARLRAVERRVLAWELQDEVAHQISNISLRVMGQGDGHDVEQLRRALGDIGSSAGSALAGLRLLVRLLRDDPATAPDGDLVGGLSSRSPSPTVSAAGWQRRLREAGFHPVMGVTAQIDELGTTTRRTIVRILDAVCDNVRRHAAAGTSCAIDIDMNEAEVTVRATNEIPETARWLAPKPGLGLRRLGQRVDLTGGCLTAGPRPAGDEGRTEWLVRVNLPRG